MDRISKEKRSKVMSAIRSTNTSPELALRKALWARGLRYKIHYGKEKIDIAFPKHKVAILVDGCFWHGCPHHYRQPTSNEGYWIPKLQKNKERDLAKEKRLMADGWVVVRLWEHEVTDLTSAIQKIMLALQTSR